MVTKNVTRMRPLQVTFSTVPPTAKIVLEQVSRSSLTYINLPQSAFEAIQNGGLFGKGKSLDFLIIHRLQEQTEVFCPTEKSEDVCFCRLSLLRDTVQAEISCFHHYG